MILQREYLGFEDLRFRAWPFPCTNSLAESSWNAPLHRTTQKNKGRLPAVCRFATLEVRERALGTVYPIRSGYVRFGERDLKAAPLSGRPGETRFRLRPFAAVAGWPCQRTSYPTEVQVRPSADAP